MPGGGSSLSLGAVPPCLVQPRALLGSEGGDGSVLSPLSGTFSSLPRACLVCRLVLSVLVQAPVPSLSPCLGSHPPRPPWSQWPPRMGEQRGQDQAVEECLLEPRFLHLEWGRGVLCGPQTCPHSRVGLGQQPDSQPLWERHTHLVSLGPQPVPPLGLGPSLPGPALASAPRSSSLPLPPT